MFPISNVDDIIHNFCSDDEVSLTENQYPYSIENENRNKNGGENGKHQYASFLNTHSHVNSNLIRFCC